MKKKGIEIDGKPWILGDDYLNMDKDTFKKTIQTKFPGTPVKVIRELSKQLHGFNNDDVPEVEDAKK